jgi:hypothetical protein
MSETVPPAVPEPRKRAKRGPSRRRIAAELGKELALHNYFRETSQDRPDRRVQEERARGAISALTSVVHRLGLHGEVIIAEEEERKKLPKRENFPIDHI